MNVKHAAIYFFAIYSACGLMATESLAQETSQLDESPQVREVMPLSFGTFALNHGAGVVEVSAKSGMCQPQGAVMVKAYCERGQFEIYGLAGRQVMVEAVTQGGPLQSIELFPENGLVTLGGDGRGLVYVGGRMSGVAAGAGNIHTQYFLQAHYVP